MNRNVRSNVLRDYQFSIVKISLTIQYMDCSFVARLLVGIILVLLILLVVLILKK